MASQFSFKERSVAALFVQFLEERAEQHPQQSMELMVAADAVNTAFGIGQADVAQLTTGGVALMDMLDIPDAPRAPAAVPTASADAAAAATDAPPTLEEQVPELAILQKSPKFRKYLEVVTSKGIFKGAAEGSAEHVARLQKVVSKFVAAYPAELEAAHQDPAALTAAADEFKNAGNALLKQKDFPGAIGSYTQAIQTDPTGPNAHIYYCNRAAARQYQRDFAGAADDSRSAIGINPKYVKSYTRLAQACISLRQWDEAISACQSALEIDSANAAAVGFLKQAENGKATQTAAATTAPPGGAGAGGGFDLNSQIGRAHV